MWDTAVLKLQICRPADLQTVFALGLEQIWSYDPAGDLLPISRQTLSFLSGVVPYRSS